MFGFLEKMFKIFAGIVIVVVLSLIGFYFANNESLPLSSDSETGDKVSAEMQENLGEKAWKRTRYISWITNKKRHYIWDKKENFAKVSWSGNEVLLDLKAKKSVVYIKGKQVNEPDRKEKLTYLANQYFSRDRFWFSAPFEVFGFQVHRSMVLLDGQSKRSLCIQYLDNHDVRAGEAYIYILDENNKPIAWKMWNDEFHLDGLRSDWIDWKKSSTGFWYPSAHRSEFFGYKIKTQNLLAGKRLKDIGLQEDPFTKIKSK